MATILIIDDQMMCRETLCQINGIEFVRMFRTQPASTHVPVIMVTSDENPGIRLEAVETGSTGFMVKPVDHHECSELCSNLLVRYQE